MALLGPVTRRSRGLPAPTRARSNRRWCDQRARRLGRRPRGWRSAGVDCPSSVSRSRSARPVRPRKQQTPRERGAHPERHPRSPAPRTRTTQGDSDCPTRSTSHLDATNLPTGSRPTSCQRTRTAGPSDLARGRTRLSNPTLRETRRQSCSRSRRLPDHSSTEPSAERVPGVRLELTRPEGQRILSPPRIPVSPPGHGFEGNQPPSP